MREAATGGPGRFALPPEAPALDFSDASVDEGYLSELGALADSDAALRARQRVDDLERRLAALE